MSPSDAPSSKSEAVEQTPSLEDRFAEFDKQLAALPSKGGVGGETIKALKETWTKARERAVRLNLAENGRATGRFLSEWVDRILQRVYQFASQRTLSAEGEPLRVTLLASGSYARREMAPFSDWDLFILHDPPANPDEDKRFTQLVGLVLRLVWDANLALGHSVRTPEECLNIMLDGVHGEQALETATALLEARFVTGDDALAKRFLEQDLPSFFRENGRPFVDAKIEEALRRHKRQGVSVYHTQPHLKDHPGALRDFQLSIWVDRASKLSGHLPRLANRPLVSEEAIRDAAVGYDRILTLRTALHGSCGRKQDVLDHRMQQQIAGLLGYEDTEELRAGELLLRDYFKGAAAIYRLTDVVIRRYREAQALASQDIERLRRRPVDVNYTRIGEVLYAAREGLYDGDQWLAMAFRAFLHSARLGIGISQEIRENIRTRVTQVDDSARRDPAVAELFLSLLRNRTNVGRVLRSMRDVGILGAYLPEFGELQDLVVQDVFHDFTVEEHTLFVVENIDRLYLSGAPSDRLRREVLERLARPELLRLAALFHDLGKSRGAAGHTTRGALMVPLLAERLGLSQSDSRMLIFLVEHHLILSEASLRRDPGEGGLLEQLAQTIGFQERLDLLYLLTCADIAAVGQGAFPKWKDELLKDLYQRLSAILDPAQALISNPTWEHGGQLESRVMARAENAKQRDLAQEHFSRVPPRYMVEVDADDAWFHIKLLEEMREKRRSVMASAHGDGALVDVWVVSSDHQNRFYRICSAFLGLGISVISAVAYTRDDGIILDRFRVSLGSDAATADKQTDPAFLEKVATEVVKTLEGDSDFRSKIEAARRRIPLAPTLTRRMEPEVHFDNKLSESHSVVDVVCGDRIGLLYGLSRALADLGCEIHFSKVDTNQGRATDVFYIKERNGGKVLDPEKAHNIKLLLRAVAQDFQQARR